MNKYQILYNCIKISGLVIFTYSLLQIPQIVTSVIGTIYVCINSVDPGISEGINHLQSTILSQQIGGLIGSVLKFAILFVLARWLLTGPRLITKWMNIDEEETNP